MTCNCIETVSKMLAEHNTRIMLPITLGQDQTLRPMIVTEQIEKGRGKKRAVGMFATFCPFCGEKLINLPAERAKPDDWPDAPLPDEQLANGGACS